MANQEHMELLKQGVVVWNAWRARNPKVRPDLRDADFTSANLEHVNLTSANLGYAKLSFAKLSHANLSSANFSSAYLRFADFSSANLSHTILAFAYLGSVDFSHANLSHAILTEADLSHANFSHADLSHANLSCAKLRSTNLTSANLRFAKLGNAHLLVANLSHTDLSHADLSSANFSGANLSGANFHKTELFHTVFANIDLCTVNGLDTLNHIGPSFVDVRTVQLPEGEICLRFLQGVGFSDIFIDYLPSMLRTAIQYESCFICYTYQNEVFAERLYKDLQHKGVRCWFARHDLRPGIPIVRGIEEAIHIHEKLLLVLSKEAVVSNWVQQEVEVAMYKEVTTGQETLFPIRLDNTVLESETLWAKRLRQRHIGDFTNWQDDDAYKQAFTTLLQHLKADKSPTL
jgi:uncharacterized protein YjbI with pentapeptide repeats